MPEAAAGKDADGGDEKTRRGVKFTPLEDMLACRAFISASDDSVRGNYQKGATFRKAMFDVYEDLCIAHSAKDHVFLTTQSRTASSRATQRRTGTVDAPVAPYVPGTNSFPKRSTDSLFRRFKDSISTDCQHFNGIVFQNPPESGQTEQDARVNHLELFLSRHHHEFKFEECYEYLRTKPKWELFCVDEKDAGTERKRGHGVKASKRAAADERRVDRIAGPIIVGESPNQPVAVGAAALPDSLMSLFREQQESMKQIAQQLAAGQMSPTTKEAMKTERELKIERDRLTLQREQIEMRERIIACQKEEYALNVKKRRKTAARDDNDHSTPVPVSMTKKTSQWDDSDDNSM
jgi:hypothetical protein